MVLEKMVLGGLPLCSIKKIFASTCALLRMPLFLRCRVSSIFYMFFFSFLLLLVVSRTSAARAA